MGRKRKQVEPVGDLKTTLPPCRVCDAPGAGFHYGANTCEACKGFFHRSLKVNHQYRCEGNGHCEIEHGRSRLCQFCRYNKCLLVGMAKEAIKTGRYTSMKRTNDILEIKRLQKIKPEQPGQTIEDVKPSSAFKDKHSVNRIHDNDNYMNTDRQPGHNSCNFQHKTGQISLQDVAEIKLEQSIEVLGSKNNELGLTSGVDQNPGVSLCSKEMLDFENVCPRACPVLHSFINKESSSSCATTLPEIESLFSESPEDPSCIQTSLQQHHDVEHHDIQRPDCQHQSSLSPISIGSPYGSPSEGSITKSSPVMLTDIASSLLSSSTAIYSSGPSSSSSAYTTSSSLHSPSSSSTSVNSPSLRSPGNMVTSPLSSLTHSAQSTSMLSNMDIQLYISNSPNSRNEVGYEQKVLEMYEDRDNIVRTLLEANETYMVPLAGKLSEEEIQQQQKEHFESCKLQQEMFGRLRRLPDHEYDYIFATTGLDMDDRQKRLFVMGVGLEKVIRAMVKFCKMIPGFPKLDIGDKVKLIKYSRQEFCMFSMYMYMNAEKKIMRGMDGLWKCENEFTRMSTDSDSVIAMENIDNYFRFYSNLQGLKLSEEELSVIKAIIVMSPDRNPHVDSQLARSIHWHLNECLIHVLSKRYPNPMIIYARIVGKLTEARSQTECIIRFFKRLKIEKYSNVLSNPLLREMCSGIFFDDKEDENSQFNCCV